jgi:hypothetical protein
MTRNSHSRKPKGHRPIGGDDDPGLHIHNVRRAYRRPHAEEWVQSIEDEEIEELEDFDELSDLEDRELGAFEESGEPEEEEQE